MTAEEVYIAQLKHSHDQLEVVRSKCELKVMDSPNWNGTPSVLKQIERLDARIDNILERLEQFTKGRI